MASLKAATIVAWEVAGRDLSVEADLAMAKRIEAVAGPLWPLSQRILSQSVSFADLARIYHILFRGYPDPPTVENLEAWAFDQGSAGHTVLGVLLGSMTVGSERLDRQLLRLQDTIDRSAAKASQNGGGAAARGPFPATDASTGT